MAATRRVAGDLVPLPQPTSAASERSLAPALLLAALAAGVVAQGAYYPGGQRVVAVLLGASLVASFAVHRPARSDLDGVGLPAVALALWVVVSAVHAGHITSAFPTLGLLAAVVTVVVLARRTTFAERDLLATGVVAIGAVVAASGWIGLAWRRVPWAIPDPDAWRAAGTLTYANAAGALLIAVGLFALARHVARPQPLSGAASALILAGAAATLSRGAVLAGIVGLGVLAVSIGPGRLVRAGLAPLLGAAIIWCGSLASVSPSASPRPGVATVTLAAGLAVAAWLPAPRAQPTRRSVAIAVVGLAVAAATGVAVAGLAPGTGRLSVLSEHRVDAAAAAIDLAATAPWFGVGPGATTLAWTTDDGDVVATHYAHNEYLQVLAELGAVGLLIVVWLGASVARSLRRSAPGLAVAPAGVRAGATAALAALAVQSATDFLWHIPVVPLIGALLVGVATAPGTPAPPNKEDVA